MRVDLASRILDALAPHIAPANARSLMQWTADKTGIRLSASELRAGEGNRLLKYFESGINLYVSDAVRQRLCAEALSDLLAEHGNASGKSWERSVPIVDEADIMVARSAGREACERVGLPRSTLVKVVTVVSELARNIFAYVGAGQLDFSTPGSGRQYVRICASDRGPGINDVDRILAGDYKSKTGMGRGLIAARNLMDEFEIQTASGIGTRITVKKYVEE